jgi:hypothetical protein
MALRRAIPELNVPLAGVDAFRRRVGEKKYQQVHSGATWGWGAINGFSPIPPMLPLFPVKIVLFIVLIIFFASVIGMSAGKTIMAAYLGQALIIMFASQWLLDNVLKHGLGV